MFSLSDSNMVQTHNHLFCKRILNLARSSLTFRQTIECGFTLKLERDMIVTYSLMLQPLCLSLFLSLSLSLFLQGAWLSFRILLYVYNVINENKTNHLDLLNTEQDKFPQDVLRHVHIVCNKYIFYLFNFIKTLNIHKNNIVSHRLPKTCETSGKPPV